MPVASAETWEGFRRAIVRIEYERGPAVLRPEPHGLVGLFTESAPVHIITAHNPSGRIERAEENRAADARLSTALSTWRTHRTIASSPEGRFQEPGFAVFAMAALEAEELGVRFGQAAIYRWAADSLTVVALDGGLDHQAGWSLHYPAAGSPE